jgi:ATP/maltotriose-dependent transcriptional regulator MalT
LLGAGTLSHYLGDEARAEPYLQQCLADARAIDVPWLAMFASLVLGITTEHRGNYDQAKPLFDEALEMARQTGDQIGLAHALSHRGLVGWASGDDQLGEELIHEALAVQRAAGDSWGTGDSLDLLGLVTSARGDYAKALTYVEESLSKRLALGAAKCTPWSFEIVGLLASAAGRSRESARLFGAAANLRERIGSPGHEPERSAYKAAIERARIDLKQSEFDLEWSAGLAHTVEGAMAETRSVIASLKSVEAPAREKPVDNGFGLTERELDVLRLLVEGRSDREIGDELYISSRTAQKHAANIFIKLNVSSRTAAATAAIRAGLVANENLKMHVSGD